MTLTPKLKYEIRSFATTFVAVFLPAAAVTFSAGLKPDITTDALVSLTVAAFRSGLKAAIEVCVPLVRAAVEKWLLSRKGKS